MPKLHRFYRFHPSQLLLALLFLVLILRIDPTRLSSSGFQVKNEDVSLLEGFRGKLEENIKQVLPSPQAELLLGIVLGSKQALPLDLKNALVNTSTIHIAVASGQNLTIVSGVVIGLASLLGRKKAVLASIFINLFYSVLTGFQVPIIRAALMNIFASAGILIGREVKMLYVLLASGLLMLIYEPSWIASISFQLSFLATFAVMEFAPQIEPRFKWLPDIIKQDLVVSGSAFLFTLPIIFENFHRVSLTGVLVNTLVLWTTPIIMVTGGAIALVSLLSLSLAALLALIPGIFLTYLIYVVDFFNYLTPSVVVESLGWIFWLGYYLVLFGFYAWSKKRLALEEGKMI